ncbi:MAG TPA: LemA family protein [Burkholderiaceae bacterium]|nr:LemA family protein [Burkholderiaceae bacterium]
MTSHWLLQIALVAVIVFWLVGGYNRLMRLRNAAAAAWGQVEPALARRGEAMHAVVAQVRASLAEEAGTLQTLLDADTRTRQAAEAVRASSVRPDTVSQWVSTEAALASPATRMKALLDLHATQLREDPACASLPAGIQAWSEADARLDFARLTFNEAVQAYNDALLQWPTRVITVVFGFKPAGRA